MENSKFLSATLIGLTLSAVAPMFGAFAFILSMLFGGGTASAAFFGIVDPTGLSLHTEGIKAVSELIYKQKFVSPDWKQFMDVEGGIKAKKQIVITGNFNGLAGSVRAACDTTPNTDSIPNVEKEWDPAYISDRFEDCFDNLQATFWKYMLANGIDKPDLLQSDYDSYVLGRLSEYMNDDMMYRLIFFTDKTIISGTTNNISGGQLKFFNMLDGVFKQLEAIVTTTPARRITITENAGANYAAQAFAAASPTVHPATDYLNQVIYGATIELRGISDPVILATQSVVDQYAQERKAVSNIELAYTRTETGMKSFEIDGIQVIAIPTLDRLIKRHFDNGTKWLNPHRILYTSKKNIRVGTEETANFSELKSEYNSYHEKWFAKFGFNMDVKVLDDGLVQYGF